MINDTPELKPCGHCGAPSRSVWDVVSYPVDIYWRRSGAATILATHETAQAAMCDRHNHGTESKHVDGRFTLSEYVKVDYSHRLIHSTAPKVKPLEWFESSTGVDGDCHTVPTNYTIRVRQGMEVRVSFSGGFAIERNVDAAKAFAQSHHKDRILSALDMG